MARSGINVYIFLVVSFFIVSTVVFVDVAVFLLLQAVNENAKRAIKVILIMFFMVFDELIDKCLKIEKRNTMG